MLDSFHIFLYCFLCLFFKTLRDSWQGMHKGRGLLVFSTPSHAFRPKPDGACWWKAATISVRSWVPTQHWGLCFSLHTRFSGFSSVWSFHLLSSPKHFPPFRVRVSCKAFVRAWLQALEGVAWPPPSWPPHSCTLPPLICPTPSLRFKFERVQIMDPMTRWHKNSENCSPEISRG